MKDYSPKHQFENSSHYGVKLIDIQVKTVSLESPMQHPLYTLKIDNSDSSRQIDSSNFSMKLDVERLKQ